MDNERDVLERKLVKETTETPFDLMSPDDKQWHIEVETLKQTTLTAYALIKQAEADKASADAQLKVAEAKLQEALNDAARLKAAAPGNTSQLRVTCSCGAELEYDGDSSEVVELQQDFNNQHYRCV